MGVRFPQGAPRKNDSLPCRFFVPRGVSGGYAELYGAFPHIIAVVHVAQPKKTPPSFTLTHHQKHDRNVVFLFLWSKVGQLTRKSTFVISENHRVRILDIWQGSLVYSSPHPERRLARHGTVRTRHEGPGHPERRGRRRSHHQAREHGRQPAHSGG